VFGTGTSAKCGLASERSSKRGNAGNRGEEFGERRSTSYALEYSLGLVVEDEIPCQEFILPV
jgi:hypothetical protein